LLVVMTTSALAVILFCISLLGLIWLLDIFETLLGVSY
jgi:hypothetical protein